jgi:hypothetical protein
MLHRQKYFGGDAKGQVIIIIRCITQSTGNEGALIGPIVCAVSSCVTPELTDRGLELIEAFDRIPLLATLETMRSLDLFSENSIGHYLGLSLRNKLAAILKPADVVEVRKPRAAVKKSRRPKRPGDQPAPRMAAYRDSQSGPPGGTSGPFFRAKARSIAFSAAATASDRVSS